MMRRKISACVAVLLLTAAIAGLFFYVGYIKQRNERQRGTLVQIFPQNKVVLSHNTPKADFNGMISKTRGCAYGK